MNLTKINLTNFRNYSKVNINLGSKINIFIGDNAQGKTNILESIVVLALTKSHRSITNPDIIQFNKKKSIIKGTVKKNRLISNLEVELGDGYKKISVNGTEIRKLSDYISNLNIILFSPDDLELIKGSPSIRRNMLNIELSQISNTYLNVYNEYNKILKTRNEYLKILFNNSIADKKYLDIITEKLISSAVIIYKKRQEYLDIINSRINYYYKNISGNDGLKVQYVPNIKLTSFDDDEIKQELKKVFDKNYVKELNYGMTMYGPHRDDFTFYFNDNDLKAFGSQGQQKLAVLAFKLSEISIFRNFIGNDPVLLLDDVFGELDIKKKNKLLKLIIDENIQSIITTTDVKNINKKYLTDAFIYEVNNGKVERK